MKIIYAVALSILLASCNCSAPAADDSKATAEVIQADKDFCTYSIKNGQPAAFIQYADSSVLSFGENALPVIGIADLKASLAKSHDTISKLTWEPMRGVASGDVGYTFGSWKFATKTKAGADTIYHGNYITAWKKEKDGSWKYTIDGGVDTPDPDKKK